LHRALAKCLWLLLTHKRSTSGSPRSADWIGSVSDQTRLLDDRRFTSTTGAANPILRRRLFLRRQFLQTTPYRASRDPSYRRNGGYPSASSSKRFTRCKQPQSLLIKIRAYGVITGTDGGGVNHLTNNAQIQDSFPAFLTHDGVFHFDSFILSQALSQRNRQRCHFSREICAWALPTFTPASYNANASRPCGAHVHSQSNRPPSSLSDLTHYRDIG
jgi:hypothetical protein